MQNYLTILVFFKVLIKAFKPGETKFEQFLIQEDTVKNVFKIGYVFASVKSEPINSLFGPLKTVLSIKTAFRVKEFEDLEEIQNFVDNSNSENSVISKTKFWLE